MMYRKKIIGILIGLLVSAGLRGPDFTDLAKDVTTTDIATAALTALIEYPLLRSSTPPLGSAVGAAMLGVEFAAASGPIYRFAKPEGRLAMKVIMGAGFVGSMGVGLYSLKQGNIKRVGEAAVVGVPAGIAMGRILWQDRSLKSSETLVR